MGEVGVASSLFAPLPASVGGECPVCLEAFGRSARLSTTTCGHTFHFDCLKKAFELRSIAARCVCPLCREDQETLALSLGVGNWAHDEEGGVAWVWWGVVVSAGINAGLLALVDLPVVPVVVVAVAVTSTLFSAVLDEVWAGEA